MGMFPKYMNEKCLTFSKISNKLLLQNKLLPFSVGYKANKFCCIIA